MLQAGQDQIIADLANGHPHVPSILNGLLILRKVEYIEQLQELELRGWQIAKLYYTICGSDLNTFLEKLDQVHSGQISRRDLMMDIDGG